jgi:DNA-binding response OmpR family regulator
MAGMRDRPLKVAVHHRFLHAAHIGIQRPSEQRLDNPLKHEGNEYYDDYVVDVHVANLRKKPLEDAASPQYLQTTRGIGYRFDPPPRLQ